MRPRSGYIFGMRKMNAGIIRTREMIAMPEPIRVNFRAL